MGETVMFWVDLSAAHLIEGSFTTGSETVSSGFVTPTSSPSLAAYFPTAKIGGGNYITVDSNNWLTIGRNNFDIASWSLLNGGTQTNTAGMTVKQAYDIDKKIDDGLPATGNVYVGANVKSSPITYAQVVTNSSPLPIAGSSTTCFDNNNVSTATLQYSVTQNGGANVNCQPNFKIQAGDQ
jgi:hypothetical protein